MTIVQTKLIKMNLFGLWIAQYTIARREPIITHIYPLLSDTNYFGLLTKLIGIISENHNGAKRTRTADPLHAMQVLYQLSYGPKFRNVLHINQS